MLFPSLNTAIMNHSYLRLLTRLIPASMLVLVVLLIHSGWGNSTASAQEESEPMPLEMRLRFQKDVGQGPETFFKSQRWSPNETALIVCDFWDYHHCLNAVRRMKEFGPTLNRVVKTARERGITIIHSPSDCMPAYAEHPARKRAQSVPKVELPVDITSWCSRIPAEENAVFPIDQSDGGEDDDPKEHAEWAEELRQLGRNPAMPWKRQNSMIPIDKKLDFISDKGDEVWRILKQRGIKNVILTGVHVNMCVLGRPFGLRQLKRAGLNVVLMRDMTDSMYNPQRRPFVSHHAGTEKVIGHIERYVCPTVTSNQLIGGRPFHFLSDPRPNLAVVIGEKEYETRRTLPAFAERFLNDYRITWVFADRQNRNSFPGLERIQDADVLLLSVRRRVPTKQQLQVIRDFVAAKKPVLGIRTSSHAFSLRNKKPPEGMADWPEFDGTVFGGSYTNHHGNKLKCIVSYTPVATRHPITRFSAYERASELSDENPDLAKFAAGGSLYKTAPLTEGSTILMKGSVLGHPAEPVAWTFQRVDGGSSFYTSLGHKQDFENQRFQELLVNALRWSLDREPVDLKKDKDADRRKSRATWQPTPSLTVPKGKLKVYFSDQKDLDSATVAVAWRKTIRFPESWLTDDLALEVDGEGFRAWLNGKAIDVESSDGTSLFRLDHELVERSDANWIVLGRLFPLNEVSQNQRTFSAVIRNGGRSRNLTGPWEWFPASADFPEASKSYLPAKFGGRTDIFMELKD